ncbi:hypothetical protein AB1Y20_014153 [Prymnesium parvum]|uniref:Uncharacterized protein n=1 Tax=Prymnesium parvum TaxID=97485 RepID=A0AB34IE64_PRYPA
MHDLPLFLLSSTQVPCEGNAVTHHDRDARSMMRRDSKDTSAPWELPFSSHSSDDDEPSCDAPPHWAPKTKRRHIVPRPPHAKTPWARQGGSKNGKEC